MDIQEIPAQLAQFWQPAETAPKDGTRILAQNARGHVAIVYWQKMQRVPDRWESCGHQWLIGGGDITAWMPLPAAKAQNDVHVDEEVSDEEMLQCLSAGHGMMRGLKLTGESEEEYNKRPKSYEL